MPSGAWQRLWPPRGPRCPIAHQALAVGQLGHFPSLHHQRPPRQLCFEHSEILEHNRFLSPWHSRRAVTQKRPLFSKETSRPGSPAGLLVKQVPPQKRAKGCARRPKGPQSQPASFLLLTDAQLGNDGAVALDVDFGQVVEKVSPLADHLQQATAE